MRPLEIVKLLEITPATNDKKRILVENGDNEEFITGLKWCLDPYVTFGVENLTPTIFSQESTGNHKDFIELLSKMLSRELTGNKLQLELTKFAKTVTEEEWRFWYARIVQKDLKCGVGVKTFNNAYKNTTVGIITVFGCQLASKAPDKLDEIKGVKLVDHKLDGVRCLAFIATNGLVTLYSRNGHRFNNFGYIEKALSKLQLPHDVVLDGEITSKSFQDLMKMVHRKNAPEATDAVFNIFDYVETNNFDLNACHLTQRERHQQMVNFYQDNEILLKNCIKIIIKNEFDFSKEVDKNMVKQTLKICKERGYEGLMIKDPDGLYKTTRNKSWLKVKPVIQVTMVIDEAVEGTGKNDGKLGSFYCHSIDQDYPNVTVNVGGGFTEEQRQVFWDRRAELIGQIIEVRADEVTETSEGMSLRFPIFIRFRTLDNNLI